MPKHAEPNQREKSSEGATTALTSLVCLLAVQAAREVLAPSTHASISGDDSKSADTSSSSTASITVTSLDSNPEEAD